MPVRWVATAAAALAVSGCAGLTIKEQMPTMMGQPFGAVTARLGLPTSEQTIAGQRVYVWRTSRLDEGTTFDCTIRVGVDANNIVSYWDFEGNEGGCANMAARLRR